MHRKSEFITEYVHYLALIAFLCAALEVAFALSFRGGMFLRLETLDRLEASLLAIYLANLLLFVAVGAGLLARRGWVYGTMLIMSAVGTILFLALFVAGAFLGGFVAGMDYLLGTLLQPLSVQKLSVDLIFVVLPFILLFNPYNLWLFSRDATVKSLFLPPQKDTPALKRKEL